MKVYTTEEEQIQALTNWFKNYGSYLVAAVVSVLLVVVGMQYWQKLNSEHLAEASTLYEQLQGATDKAEQEKVAKNLLDNYRKTVYGKVAGLYFANQKVSANNWTSAEKDYKWIYDETDTWPDLQVVAFENWIRSLLELKENDKAYNNLTNAEKNTNFVKLYPLNFYNLKGDVLYRLGKNEEAVAAYNQAIEAAHTDPELFQQMAQFANWVILKRNDLLVAKPLG